MTLTAFLAAYEPLPFDWRVANCCHFAAAWVKAKTGVDPMEGLRRTPTRFSALRLIARCGGSLEAAWTLRLGRPAIPATFAQEGDVVLLQGRAGVAVCAGRVAVAVEVGGAFVFVPMREADRAWRT